MVCRGLLCIAIAIAGVAATARHHQMMRGAPLDTPKELQDMLVTAFAGVFKGPAQAGAAKIDQPVQAQIEDEKIEDFQRTLSPACRKRFNAMMAGTGPSTTSFDAHGSAKEGAKQCKKLEGDLCFTKAQITESQKAPDGRKLAQTTAVEGSSCVPAECSDSSDLMAYSQFMRQQTKNLMPGDTMKIALHVDCSRSGGAVAMIDGDGKAAPMQQRRSGATAMAPVALAALTVVFAAVF